MRETGRGQVGDRCEGRQMGQWGGTGEWDGGTGGE